MIRLLLSAFALLALIWRLTFRTATTAATTIPMAVTVAAIRVCQF
jgi:hypothetical protein